MSIAIIDSICFINTFIGPLFWFILVLLLIIVIIVGEFMNSISRLIVFGGFMIFIFINEEGYWLEIVFVGVNSFMTRLRILIVLVN